MTCSVCPYIKKIGLCLPTTEVEYYAILQMSHQSIVVSIVQQTLSGELEFDPQ